MVNSRSESYKAAGVDVTAGYEAVKKMKPFVESTYIPGVLGSIGGFGGMFEPPGQGMEHPILVSGTDGVGTKLKLAFLMDKHDTVGIDCVAMCVNDIACCGAKPLFFLDYIAVGKNYPERIAELVKGIADGCRQAGCALIGGETAEMPGFYPVDEYDMAGFSVGLIDRDKMIDGTKLAAGDVLIGVASSGVHSNGYSLVRKTLGINEKSVQRYISEFGKTLGEELLTPTKIYVKTIQSLIASVDVKAMSHITGGGFYENIPRMLKDGTRAVVEKNSYPVLPIFKLLAEKGNIEEQMMYNTYNMGLGMVLAVDAADVDKTMEAIKVSVVVPVYNVDEFLDNTLSDITGQTLREIEIICVDDGSTDNSCKIIEEWMEKDSRIQLIRQKNQYAGVARNNGLKQAHGKYVIFWDADDLFEHNALEVMYAQAEQENSDICICEARKYDNAKEKYIPSDAYLKEDLLPGKQTFNKFDVPDYIFNLTNNVPWNKLYLKEFITKNKLQYQAIKQANDTYFTIMALFLAERIICERCAHCLQGK